MKLLVIQEQHFTKLPNGEVWVDKQSDTKFWERYLNVFDEIVALSGYGDLGKNILMESYLTTFSFLNFGKGSAMTYIVLFFALLLGIFYLRNLNKEVDY